MITLRNHFEAIENHNINVTELLGITAASLQNNHGTGTESNINYYAFIAETIQN